MLMQQPGTAICHAPLWDCCLTSFFCLDSAWLQSGFTLEPGRVEQHEALISALSDVLWQAHVGPMATLVVPGPDVLGGGAALDYDQLSRCVTSLQASSQNQLQVRGVSR